MNVFIDSNALYRDYFFENKSNNKILDYCKDGLLSLYMSEVVKLELRRQFQKEIELKNREIKKISKDAIRLKIENDLKEVSVDDQLSKFDDFYNKLIRLDHFYVLPYRNDFLPDIVDRAIYRKKPFTEEKSELKDALIWKTYSDFVEQNDLSECILLTNNTSDFCDKNDKSSIHLDLQGDTKKFSVVNTSFDFIKTKGPTLESPEYKFQQYYTHLTIDDRLVYEIITDKFDKQIERRIHEEVDNLHPSDILSNDFFFDAQLVGYDVEILECEDIEHEILTDTALVSGVVYVSCETEILEYNAVRDPGEDTYLHAGEKNITFKVYFNFDLGEHDRYTDFEITDVEVYDIN